MKKVEAQINIGINLTCPHCGEYIDLFDQNHFQGLHDDGYIYRKLLGDTFGCKDFDETITCPECKKEIKIGQVHW